MSGEIKSGLRSGGRGWAVCSFGATPELSPSEFRLKIYPSIGGIEKRKEKARATAGTGLSHQREKSGSGNAGTAIRIGAGV